MAALTTATSETLLARYAVDIAFVAEEWPATTLTGLAEQMQTAAEHMAGAGIQGTDDLETAATCLLAAETPDLTERMVYLTRAARFLTSATDMVDEYRLML